MKFLAGCRRSCGRAVQGASLFWLSESRLQALVFTGVGFPQMCGLHRTPPRSHLLFAILFSSLLLEAVITVFDTEECVIMIHKNIN